MISKIRAYVSENRKELFFVVLIFLLAFAIRGHLMIYDWMFGFDPYFHARLGEYVAQTFTIPSVDPLAYYQVEGGATLPASGGFFWFFTAILYKIIFLGASSKESWITAVKFFPAFFGALISAAMYYLGKEMYNKKAGLTMAFFAAVVPSFVYRTMAGFFEDDALGFLWMVFGLIFFVRAVKKAEFSRQTMIDSLIAALFFALMAWTWGMFILVPIILVAWFPSTIALMWFRKEPNIKIINIAKNFAITFAVFAVLATILTGTGWIDSSIGYVSSYLPVSQDNITRINTPGGDGSSIYSISVGEEQSGIRFWGNKYSALIFFPFAAILLFIPYRLLRKKNDYVTFLALYWIIVTMLMAYIRLKFTYVFGLPIAVAAGITLSELFSWVGERPGFEKKTIAVILGFMFLIGASAGTFFVSQNVPSIEQSPGWKDGMLWLKNNTPVDSKIFNWWDQGHWITFVAERAVTTDNRNYQLKFNSDVALFMLSESKEETDAIMQKYYPDYIVFGEDLLGKMGSLGLYAYNTTTASDARVARFTSRECQLQQDSVSNNIQAFCGYLTDEQGRTLITSDNKPIPIGFQFTMDQFNGLPKQRIEEPNVNAGNISRGFLYRIDSGTTKVFYFNKAANDTMLVKLFLDIDNLDGYEKAYSSGEMFIFKPTFINN